MFLLTQFQFCQRFLIRRGFSPVQRLLLTFGSMLAVVILVYWVLARMSMTSVDFGPVHFEDTKHRKLQARLDYMAKNLQITFEIMTNFEGSEDDEKDSSNRARINLRNTGTDTITKWNWHLYFFGRQKLWYKNEVHGNIVANLQMKLEKVHGGLYQLSPTETFQNILPGQTLEIIYLAKGYVISRTDMCPNWFVAAPELQARVLGSTTGETLSFVKPFDTEAKWKRGHFDRYDPFNPQRRYNEYSVKDVGSAQNLIVPTPFHVSYEKSRSVVIDDKWVIVVQEGVGKEADREAKYLSEKLGLRIQSNIPEDHYILLNLGGASFTADQDKNADEAYNLNSFGGDKEQILIAAQTSHGIFYGIQTLLNMMDLETRAVLHANVQDVPRFPYRGLMLDVARNFLPKAEVLKIIEVMATYKLNKLHLHLSDDEGWRLQIPGLDELTEIGVRKGFDLTERSGLLPFLGSIPSRSLAGSGYYTVSQYQAILRHAAKHHVTVIPEFDMPGHAHAAIKAMEARARRLATRDKGVAAGHYLLSDPEDKSEYESVQQFTDDAINPCLESTYNFVEHVITKVQDIHKNIQKLKTFHFGGDEVPKGTFSDSPACDSFRQDNPIGGSTDSLKAYFVKRVANIITKHGLQPQGWEDAFYSDKTILSKTGEGRIVNAWKNTWLSGMSHQAYELANAGFEVVLSHPTHLYLDHAQEPDPEERGLYWATRYIDTKKVFTYNAWDTYSNIDGDTDKWGAPLTRDEVCESKPCTPLELKQNIIGMEGAVWGETIRTNTHLEYMVFPRLLALAERAWHQAAWETEPDPRVRRRQQGEDWELFANTLGYRELRRLDKLGIEYRLPVPGAVKEDGKLKVITEFPGLPIQYSADGGVTWNDWKTEEDHTSLSGRLLLASRSFDSKSRSRSIEFNL